MAVAGTARPRTRTRDDPSVTRRRPSFPPDVSCAPTARRQCLAAPHRAGLARRRPARRHRVDGNAIRDGARRLDARHQAEPAIHPHRNRAEGARVALVNVAPLLAADATGTSSWRGTPIRCASPSASSAPASSGTGSPGRRQRPSSSRAQSTDRLIPPAGSGCVWPAANARPPQAQTRTTRRRRRSARRSRAGPARRRA